MHRTCCMAARERGFLVWKSKIKSWPSSSQSISVSTRRGARASLSRCSWPTACHAFATKVATGGTTTPPKRFGFKCQKAREGQNDLLGLLFICRLVELSLRSLRYLTARLVCQSNLLAYHDSFGLSFHRQPKRFWYRWNVF